MVDVWLPYGKTEVCARVPTENLQDIIEARDVSGVENPKDEIKRALKNPIGTESLAETVKSGDKVALALNIFDPTVVKLVISSIMEEAAQSGLKANDLTVIFAHEIFNSNETSFKNQLISEISPLGVNLIFHSPSSESTYVGETSTGIKVYLNKIFAESKMKIAIGTVKPNPYALYDWSGYNIVPGLSSPETIKQIFMPALNLDSPSDLIHKNIMEASRIVGVNFSLNIIINRKGEIVKSVAGDSEKAFWEASKIADEIYGFTIEKRADVVLISPGGSPFDMNVSRACRCLENALKTVRRRGIIVLVAECPEGYGDPEFYEAISRFKNDLNSLGKSLRRRFRVSGFVAYRFLRAFRRAEISMVSAIPDYYASEIPDLKVFRTANEALNYALEKCGRRSKVSVFPHGNLVIPAAKSSPRRNIF